MVDDVSVVVSVVLVTVELVSGILSGVEALVTVVVAGEVTVVVAGEVIVVVAREVALVESVSFGFSGGVPL